MSRIETIAKGVTLYLGDCRDVLPLLAVDAVITDPPYGVGFKYENSDDSSVGYREWCDDWFQMAKAAASGPVAISCGMSNLADWPKPDWVLCWHKPAAMGRCFVGFNNWEPVILYGRGSRGQIADVFTAPIIPSENLSEHPCPKPLGWATSLVDRLTTKGESVCDPFMGSGTTGVACIKLGRRFVGIEIEPKYFDLACRRIEEATKQPDLFIERELPAEQMSLTYGDES